MIQKLASDLRIATMASQSELAFQRALGRSPREAYDASYRVFDDILTIAGAPELPYVWQEPKTITGRR